MNTSKVNLSSALLYQGSWPFVIAVLISLAIASYLGILTPRLIVDLGKNYNTDAFYTTIHSLFWLFVCTYFNRAAYQITLNKYVQNLVLNIRNQCYTRWLLSYDIQTGKHPIDERYPQGEVTSRIITDTESLRELMTSGTFGIIIDACFVAASLASFIFINDKLGTSLGLFLVIASGLLFWGSKYIREIFHTVRRARGHVHRILANLIGGFGESYYTDHRRYAEKMGEKVFDDFLKKIFKSNFWDASYYSLAESLYPLTLLFAALIFPYSGVTETAIVLATIDIIQKSINPIKDIASKIANVQRAATGIQRINEFFGDLAKGESSPLMFETQNIHFQKFIVHIKDFTYPTPRGGGSGFALSNIKFEGEPGDLLGIAGFSGSGKSTLLNILAGNTVPDDFQITIKTSNDDILYGSDHPETAIRYREQVGLISQDSHIFTETLQFNITMGKGTKEEFASFWSWICDRIAYFRQWGKKPQDILINDELSIGQKQLISTVRSCFLKKKIVLFDEISSGLDSELEAALREAVQVVQTLSLIIIVAHRIETLINSNRIFLMENGTIVSSGTDEQLRSASPIYKKFIKELGNVEKLG